VERAIRCPTLSDACCYASVTLSPMVGFCVTEPQKFANCVEITISTCIANTEARRHHLADQDPVAVVRYIFMKKPEFRKYRPRKHIPRPCERFTPHANPDRTRSCVKCGRPKAAHDA
jgi:hypothetical protein